MRSVVRTAASVGASCMASRTSAAVACPRAYTISSVSCSRRLSLGLGRAMATTITEVMLKNQHHVENPTIHGFLTLPGVHPSDDIEHLYRSPSHGRSACFARQGNTGSSGVAHARVAAAPRRGHRRAHLSDYEGDLPREGGLALSRAASA